MPEIEVDGSVLFYEENGSGTPLLLIHGTGADAAEPVRREGPAKVACACSEPGMAQEEG